MEHESIKEMIRSLERIDKTGKYDVDKYCYSLMHQTGQLEYFYCNLVKDGSIDKTFYRVSHKPQAHQLAYFNIGRGFPKEIMDAHWCYVVKDMGCKSLIIPCTSIKDKSQCSSFELEITIKMNNQITKCRIQLSDIRSVDNQRLDERKEFVDVLTPRKDIMKFIISHIIVNK